MVVTGQGVALLLTIQWGMDRDATKHSTMHRMVPTTNNQLIKNDNSGEVMKPFSITHCSESVDSDILATF